MTPISQRTAVGARMTIYTRGRRKIYHADYHHEGKHCRKSLKTTNKKVAQRKAAELERSLDDGTPLVNRQPAATGKSVLDLEKGSDEYLRYLKTEGRRRRTVDKQRGILTRFRDYAGQHGIRDLRAVDLRLIDGYRAERKKTLSEKSMTNEGQVLKQVLGWCAERQLIPLNPLAAQKFRPPKYEPREAPTGEQVDNILSTAPDLRYPVLATLAFTGARSGEVSHLRLEDVDLEGNWLHFVSRPGFETKSGNSRKVPIHESLRPILEVAVRNRKCGWLFTALPSRKYPNGDHHISTKHLNEDFKHLLESLKLPAGQDGGFTIHSLRRSFKTICVNANVPREVVDAWQDHVHVRTAGDLYYKLSDAESQKFMKIVPIGKDMHRQSKGGG